jgi:hypothetical protein
VKLQVCEPWHRWKRTYRIVMPIKINSKRHQTAMASLLRYSFLFTENTMRSYFNLIIVMAWFQLCIRQYCLSSQHLVHKSATNQQNNHQFRDAADFQVATAILLTDVEVWSILTEKVEGLGWLLHALTYSCVNRLFYHLHYKKNGGRHQAINIWFLHKWAFFSKSLAWHSYSIVTLSLLCRYVVEVNYHQKKKPGFI